MSTASSQGTTAQPDLRVIMPVFNDWESAERLLADIDAEFAGDDVTIEAILVDDGSIQRPPASLAAGQRIRRVTCLKLGTNVGHQRAIAIGLADASRSATSGHHGLPNWATTVLGFAIVISFQALMMPILMVFMLLNARGQIQPPPERVVLDYLAERIELAGPAATPAPVPASAA
ncbi:glycosyltransferase [Alteraurantiacibacter buctensis]|uniref:Glycosyltransferase n=1 Tax=Alteraurantiacibacter buctensis TaxID=1503981 RepID=A0A844YX37_9SPHN|nr:glycosyltransferase [Alteraurantiacibacter buctensis]MXO70637.1 glycosyltransferase [Alteraurantiacibacter buctensis]